MRWIALTGAVAALTLSTPGTLGQVAQADLPALPQQAAPAQTGAMAHVGPGTFQTIPDIQGKMIRMMDVSESALLQPAGPGNPDAAPGVGIGAGGSRYIDQPLNCNTGWVSNNNSNWNPYLRFDDFVADGSPLSNVRFYGGVYLGTGSLAELTGIGIEIWSITSGGECGWTYSSFQGGQFFSIAELNPVFACDTGGFYDAYEFTANFASAISLNAGQNYMITVYGTLANPDSTALFTWNESTESNYNPAESWDRTNGAYPYCSPDNAFATNVSGACQDNDCSTIVYFSNYPMNNNNPYISLDDFVAPATEDLLHLQFSGGAWDVLAGTPTNLGNQAGFYIELYGASQNPNYPCDNYVTNFLGAYTVSMADANPKFQCVDTHGITEYQFSIAIPAGTYPLVAGGHYMLGVYGISNNSNDGRIFCWGTTDAVYDLNSWSFNLSTGSQEVCHVTDQAFCVNPPRPCLGDFNQDGTVNTLDVLAFLNAWSNGSLAADCNGDGVVNTIDVLCFLNRWSAGC